MAIELQNVKKNFEDVQAVNDLSLNIKEGELFGLVRVMTYKRIFRKLKK